VDWHRKASPTAPGETELATDSQPDGQPPLRFGQAFQVLPNRIVIESLAAPSQQAMPVFSSPIMKTERCDAM
jgi:hypothetical protein